MILKKMHQTGIFGIITAFSVAALSSSGCQRSQNFKKDQEFYQGEASTYYNKGKGPTQRLEQSGQPKKRVLVFDFWNDTPIRQPDIGFFAADELRRNLFLSQRVVVPPEIKSEFTTEDFIQGEKVKVAQLIREGRKLGISVVVVGRISKITVRQRGDDVGLFRQKQSMAAVDVELKMFDVNAGREIMAVGKSGETSETATVTADSGSIDTPEYRAEITKLALRKALLGATSDVLRAVEKMAWEGMIAKVNGAKVYINAGKASGLVLGDILKVMAPGDDVYDPSTGAFLGRTQGQLKGTLEVVDFLGTDGAVSEIHTGAGFKEGDTVQLY